MSQQITRKRDTGEAGNPGQFGSTGRGEADVDFEFSSEPDRPETFSNWTEVDQHLTNSMSITASEAPDGTDLGYAQMILHRDEYGSTYLQLTQDYEDHHTDDPDFRAFMASRGATTPDGSTYLSPRIEIEDLSDQSIDGALDAADEKRAFRLSGHGSPHPETGSSHPEIGGFDEYAQQSYRTRRLVANDTAGTLYENALGQLQEEAFTSGDEDYVEPNTSEQILEIEDAERQFLADNWDLIQVAAQREDLSPREIAKDISAHRLWGADVTSRHGSLEFQMLLTKSEGERLVRDLGPGVDDNGQIIWE